MDPMTTTEQPADVAYQAMLTGLRRTVTAAAVATGVAGRWVALVRQDAERRMGVDGLSDAVLDDPRYVAALDRWATVRGLCEQAQAVLDAAETNTTAPISREG